MGASHVGLIATNAQGRERRTEMSLRNDTGAHYAPRADREEGVGGGMLYELMVVMVVLTAASEAWGRDGLAHKFVVANAATGAASPAERAGSGS